MDISNIKNFITANAGKSLLVGRKYSPEILTGVGVAGVVTAAVLACRATLKLFDVIIPTIKVMLQDVVSEGTQRLLFGDSRRRNVSNSRSTASYTSYNRYYDREPRQREEPRMSHREYCKKCYKRIY